MATWGSYFGTFYKKNSKQESEQADTAEELSEKSILGTKSTNLAQNSVNSSPKKLYRTVTEPIGPANEQLPRLNSNAARVANLFGYDNSAAVQVTTDELKVAEQVSGSAISAVRGGISTEFNAQLNHRKRPQTDLSSQDPPKVAEQGSGRARSAAGVGAGSEVKVQLNRANTAQADLPSRNPSKSSPKKPAARSRAIDLLDGLENLLHFETPASQPLVAQVEGIQLKLDTTVANGVDTLKERLAQKNENMKPTIQSFGESPTGSQETSISSVSRTDSFWSEVSPVIASQSRKNSSRSRSSMSSATSNPNVASSRKEPDQEQVNFREEFLEYARGIERMRIEREEMDAARKRMLEEEARSEREAARFAEEEEQMRLFIENVQREREREQQEEQRKFREEEAARLETEWLAKEQEEKILREKEESMLQFEKLVQEEEERLTRQEEEEERLTRQEEEEERLARQEEEAVAREREEWLAKKRMNRLAQEEADRLQQKHQEEVEAEWLRDENGAAEREEQARRARRSAGLDNEKAEQGRYPLPGRLEENEESEGSQYEDDEEYEEEEVLTKEEEMKKAEEKIRAAFAGLAKERSQAPDPVQDRNQSEERSITNYAKTVNQPGRNMMTDNVGDGMNSGRGVSRYNTVGARTEIRGTVQTGSNANTGGFGVLARSNTVGLPNGPRGGLPAGPKLKTRVPQ